MPEPGTVKQEKKENQKQQVPGKSEPVFRKKVHNKCFFESVAAQFHIFRSNKYRNKNREYRKLFI